MASRSTAALAVARRVPGGDRVAARHRRRRRSGQFNAELGLDLEGGASVDPAPADQRQEGHRCPARPGRQHHPRPGRTASASPRPRCRSAAATSRSTSPVRAGQELLENVIEQHRPAPVPAGGARRAGARGDDHPYADGHAERNGEADRYGHADRNRHAHHQGDHEVAGRREADPDQQRPRPFRRLARGGRHLVGSHHGCAHDLGGNTQHVRHASRWGCHPDPGRLGCTGGHLLLDQHHGRRRPGLPDPRGRRQQFAAARRLQPGQAQRRRGCPRASTTPRSHWSRADRSGQQIYCWRRPTCPVPMSRARRSQIRRPTSGCSVQLNFTSKGTAHFATLTDSGHLVDAAAEPGRDRARRHRRVGAGDPRRRSTAAAPRSPATSPRPRPSTWPSPQVRRAAADLRRWRRIELISPTLGSDQLHGRPASPVRSASPWSSSTRCSTTAASAWSPSPACACRR